jgi:hypothetical protein
MIVYLSVSRINYTIKLKIYLKQNMPPAGMDFADNIINIKDGGLL